MSKLNPTTVVLFSITFILTVATWADDTQATPSVVAKASDIVPATPNWKVNLMSYYYDIKGKKAADSNEYDFDKLNTRIDLLSVSYTLSPAWTFNVLAQHYEFYTETIFPKFSNVPDYARSYDRTEGAGDTYLTLITPITYQNSWLVIGDFGVSVPTGTINNKSNLPGLQDYNLAYNAQHGSGTYDAIGGLTALYMQPKYLFGSRAFADVRAGKNSNDYTLGNMYRLDSWVDYNAGAGFTPRVAGFYRHKEAIHNFDKTRGEIAGDKFYRHAQANWDISAALKYQYDLKIAPISLAVEAGVPVAQGCNNVDHSEVVTNYYTSFSMNGSF